jgi:hypothetical protein
MLQTNTLSSQINQFIQKNRDNNIHKNTHYVSLFSFIVGVNVGMFIQHIFKFRSLN